MSLLEFAKEEMRLLNGNKPDVMQEAITEDILELIKVFSKQGHSGFSASYALNTFCKLARYKPITALSFDDEWWSEYKDNSFQHRRNSAIFKEGKNGKPYYINAYTMCWEDDPANCWGGSLLLKGNKRVRRCYIKDPNNIPNVRILIPVISTGDDSADWEFKPISKRKLKELKKYYDIEIVKIKGEEKNDRH